MAIFYFAWVDAGEAFNPNVHNREDEKILNFEIEHNEGDFASLRIVLRNPKVGLLGAGRNLWCWLSWNNGGSPDAIEPLFTGRLIGIPEDISDERARLQFISRPPDYDLQRSAIADNLKVDPYWDPIFLQDSLDDVDAVLEAYPAAWHIDRTTLVVSASDLLVGESGTLDVGVSEHLYDALGVSYSSPPIKRVNITATVTWTQAGTGSVDLTNKLVTAFQAAGSPMKAPLVSSMTGDGLLSSWPKAGASLGGGWTLHNDSTAELATWIRPPLKTYYYVKQASDVLDEDGQTTIDTRPGVWEYSYLGGWKFVPDTSTTTTTQGDVTWETWGVIFPLGTIKIYFLAAWEASRDRTETVTFALEGDIQALLADPDEDISVTSDVVGEAVDPSVGSPGFFDTPIGDVKRNSYFTTDRGNQSLRYLIALGRAKLRSRARAIEVEFTTAFEKVSGLDCSWNVSLHDGRLPGGLVTGKVIRVLLSVDGDSGELKGTVSLGVSIGNGGAGDAVIPGTPTYAADGYMDVGYQIMTGGTIDIGTTDVTYGTLDEDVIDDDGVDLFNITAASAVSSIVITDGVTDQLAALSKFKSYNSGASLPGLNDPSNNNEDDPITVLEDHYTQVTLNLVPISNQSFKTEFTPTVSVLAIPQGVNLEAT